MNKDWTTDPPRAQDNPTANQPDLLDDPSRDEHSAVEALKLYENKKSYAAVAATMGISRYKAKKLVLTGRHLNGSKTAEIKKNAYQMAVDAYTSVVNYMKLVGHYDHDNMDGSAERAANALMEMIQPKSIIEKEISAVLMKTFPMDPQDKEDGASMVISLDNRVVSLCPHHFLPVIYMVDMAYLPHHYYFGLSKPTRLAEILGRRPVLQEKFTTDLANVLFGRDLEGKQIAKTLGSAVRVRGWHSCMSCRGIRHHHSNVVTRVLRGAFMEDHQVLAEFDANLPSLPVARGVV